MDARFNATVVVRGGRMSGCSASAKPQPESTDEILVFALLQFHNAPQVHVRRNLPVTTGTGRIAQEDNRANSTFRIAAP